jgi:hypothetical protein
MKVNLELKNHEDICEFSFSINKPYVKKVIGYGPYNNNVRFNLLPDFTGDTEAQAQATANKIGVKVRFEGTSGTVVEQSYPANKRIDLIKDTLVLKLSGNKKQTADDDKKEKEETDKEKEDSKDKEKEEEEKQEEKKDESTDTTEDKKEDE